uniref:(northern house mosquito) hypothetical protein n=1 Tax=Culex pipiens TaxID=7175 RepID=A0A8D8C239_CULPI
MSQPDADRVPPDKSGTTTRRSRQVRPAVPNVSGAGQEQNHRRQHCHQVRTVPQQDQERSRPSPHRAQDVPGEGPVEHARRTAAHRSGPAARLRRRKGDRRNYGHIHDPRRHRTGPEGAVRPAKGRVPGGLWQHGQGTAGGPEGAAGHHGQGERSQEEEGAISAEKGVQGVQLECRSGSVRE